MTWTVAQIVEATRGRLAQGNLRSEVLRINTDSREAALGDCFVALVGENFDGHDFLEATVTLGASALVVREGLGSVMAPAEVAIVAVPDTLNALGHLARFHRHQYTLPVVGITGSNGKTSSKEMLAKILEQDRNVLKNKGNFNNLVGVPLTLLQLNSQHKVAVVEMGINIPGEMVRLVEISQPTAGLITNIQPAHLQGLKSADAILAEKGKLLQGLGPEGIAIINVDDERLSGFAEGLAARKITYSITDQSADVHVLGKVHLDDRGSSFKLALGEEPLEVFLPVLGMHQAQNAVAAAAAAYALGVSAAGVAQGLANHVPVTQRMQVQQLADGTRILNDTYNANPVSTVAAVETVASVRGARPFIAVLGEMRELGERSRALHHQVGEQVGLLGVDRLITLGEMAEEIGKGAQLTGMRPEQCFHARDHREVVTLLQENWQSGAWILIKGSRGMRMERVVEGILAR
jgi:UDP-N-acetylmuramoyl-tripeptide--D-alanyl-D-alanine ligase